MTSIRALLLTIFRSIAGYMVLFACVVVLLKRPPFTFGTADIVFFATLLAVAFANANAARGARGPAAGVRNFVLHVAVGAAVWLGSQSVQVLQ